MQQVAPPALVIPECQSHLLRAECRLDHGQHREAGTAQCFEVSGLFANGQERATVYTRTEGLWRSGRLVGSAYNALKGGYYSEQAGSLPVVENALFAQRLGTVMSLLH